MTDKLKMILAVLSFLASVVIGFIAMFIPPSGEIHSSILWFVAQMLVFCATLLGLNLTLGKASTTKLDK